PMLNTMRRPAQRRAWGLGDHPPVGCRGEAPHFVPIEAGKWVRAHVEHFYPGVVDGDLIKALERLQEGGSGWDCLRSPSDQFEVVRVAHVMPKSFRCAEGLRHRRNHVVASAGSAGEMWRSGTSSSPSASLLIARSWKRRRD
ncbi:hypothetical protein AB4144_15000, partial [Rhizobiaceae sp. 2RAB30]